MDEYIIKHSNRKDKKYMLETPSGKLIHFGAKGYRDFTLLDGTSEENELVRQRYIKRHQNESSRWIMNK